MRRVKLTTEWAEWKLNSVNYAELTGAYDFVANVSRHERGYWFRIFPCARVAGTVVGIPPGYQYDADDETYEGATEYNETMEQAQHKAELRLIEYGLIDIIWWVTQENDC